MSDANYRCRSCKTRVTMAMAICPICGEPITLQTALLNAGSSAPATVVTRHNSAASGAATQVPSREAPQPIPAPFMPVQSWAEMVSEMATPTLPETAPNLAAYAYPASSVKTRMAGKSFAMYVACVVMVLAGSFLIGLGLARRYTANEQAAQNAAAPAKIFVVQASAGVGGPLKTEVAEKAK